MRDHEGTRQIECNNISMRTKLKIPRLEGLMESQSFDEKSFFKTLLGFTAD